LSDIHTTLHHSFGKWLRQSEILLVNISWNNFKQLRFRKKLTWFYNSDRTLYKSKLWISMYVTFLKHILVSYLRMVNIPRTPEKKINQIQCVLFEVLLISIHECELWQLNQSNIFRLVPFSNETGITIGCLDFFNNYYFFL
jgi:hypothetical protein